VPWYHDVMDMFITASRDERQFSSGDMQPARVVELLRWLGFEKVDTWGDHDIYRLTGTKVKMDVPKSAEVEGRNDPERRFQTPFKRLGEQLGLPLPGKKLVKKLWQLWLSGGWKGSGRPPPDWTDWAWWEDPWWHVKMLREAPVQAPVPVRWPSAPVRAVDAHGAVATLEFEGDDGWYWCKMSELPRGMRLGQALEYRLAPDQAEPPELAGLGLGLVRVEVRAPTAGGEGVVGACGGANLRLGVAPTGGGGRVVGAGMAPTGGGEEGATWFDRAVAAGLAPAQTWVGR